MIKEFKLLYVLVWFECIVDINLDNNKSVVDLCIYI